MASLSPFPTKIPITQPQEQNAEQFVVTMSRMIWSLEVSDQSASDKLEHWAVSRLRSIDSWRSAGLFDYCAFHSFIYKRVVLFPDLSGVVAMSMSMSVVVLYAVNLHLKHPCHLPEHWQLDWQRHFRVTCNSHQSQASVCYLLPFP